MKNRDKIIDEASSKFSIDKQFVVEYMDKIDLICKGFFENRAIYRNTGGLPIRGNFEIIDIPNDDQKLAEMIEYVLNNLYGINTCIKRGGYVCDDDYENPLYYNEEYYYQIVLFY